jgi:hypothetical protein
MSEISRSSYESGVRYKKSIADINKNHERRVNQINRDLEDRLKQGLCQRAKDELKSAKSIMVTYDFDKVREANKKVDFECK